MAGQIGRQFDKLFRGRIKERTKPVKDQEQKAGDSCKMEDGSDGILEEKEGKLVCILSKKDSISKRDNLETDIWNWLDKHEDADPDVLAKQFNISYEKAYEYIEAWLVDRGEGPHDSLKNKIIVKKDSALDDEAYEISQKIAMFLSKFPWSGGVVKLADFIMDNCGIAMGSDGEKQARLLGKYLSNR